MRARGALIVLLTTGLLAGCTTSVVGPEGQSTASYRLGRLRDTVPTNIATLYDASMQAVQQLGLKVTQAKEDQLEGTIVARTVDDEKITIDLTSITDQATKLTINTGSLPRARRVYQAIIDNMRNAAAQL